MTKKMINGFMASVLAILLSANCIFAQTQETIIFSDDFSSDSGWVYSNAYTLSTDTSYHNYWRIHGGKLFICSGIGDLNTASYEPYDKCAPLMFRIMYNLAQAMK